MEVLLKLDLVFVAVYHSVAWPRQTSRHKLLHSLLWYLDIISCGYASVSHSSLQLKLFCCVLSAISEDWNCSFNSSACALGSEVRWPSFLRGATPVFDDFWCLIFLQTPVASFVSELFSVFSTVEIWVLTPLRNRTARLFLFCALTKFYSVTCIHSIFSFTRSYFPLHQFLPVVSHTWCSYPYANTSRR